MGPAKNKAIYTMPEMKTLTLPVYAALPFSYRTARVSKLGGLSLRSGNARVADSYPSENARLCEVADGKCRAQVLVLPEQNLREKQTARHPGLDPQTLSSKSTVRRRQ